MYQAHQTIAASSRATPEQNPFMPDRISLHLFELTRFLQAKRRPLRWKTLHVIQTLTNPLPGYGSRMT